MACVSLGIHSAGGNGARPEMPEIISPYGDPPCVAEAASSWPQASEVHRFHESQAPPYHAS
jgi:hypothetical protein